MAKEAKKSMSYLHSENDVIFSVKMNENNKMYSATDVELGLSTSIVKAQPNASNISTQNIAIVRYRC